MRGSKSTIALPGPDPVERRDWQTIRTLLPYLWEWKWRVVLALVCLVAAKFANIGVPLVLKDLIDALSISKDAAPLLVPLGLLGAYGALRFSTALFTELREIIFARVTQRAQRTIALKLFQHLHSLDFCFFRFIHF